MDGLDSIVHLVYLVQAAVSLQKNSPAHMFTIACLDKIIYTKHCLMIIPHMLLCLALFALNLI